MKSLLSQNWNLSLYWLFCLFCGCTMPDRPAISRPDFLEAGKIYLFRDQSQVLEYAFYFRDNEIFARVATFGKYDDPKWYLLREIPTELVTSLRQWIAPNIGDPVEHAWYSRTIFAADTSQQAQRVFFPPESNVSPKKVKKWFNELSKATIKSRYRVKEVPQWIKDDPRIDKRFGLGAKPSWPTITPK